jgi:hypothetical protein
MNSRLTIEAMRAAAYAIESASDLDAVRAIQAAQDALDAEKAARIGAIRVSRSFELEGASSVATWAKNELRLNAREAKAMERAAPTLEQLPKVAEAAASGLIRLAHVHIFTYGIRHVGAQLMIESQDWLLDVARHWEPAELFDVMKKLKAAVHPESLDDAWKKGMDKADFQVQPVPGGYHVTGFLDVTAGAKLQAVLDALSAPRDADDLRTGAERRVQAVEDLADSVLEHGLPSDKGFRPQMTVHADADTLDDALSDDLQESAAPGEPATLAGYGQIGPMLLSLIACNADVTPVLTHRQPAMDGSRLSNQPGGRRVPRTQSQVLNVGRTQRFATRKQRIAVLARQEGVCAAPGCSHTHLEIHHVLWWHDHGGPTDLDLMVGLCRRCHHLVHRELLRITADGIGGFSFTDRDNRALLAGYHQRQAAHRELGRIRKVAARVAQRRRERSAPFIT